MQRKETQMSQLAIIALLEKGYTRKEIMSFFDISRDTIQKAIRARYNTKDLTENPTYATMGTNTGELEK